MVVVVVAVEGITVFWMERNATTPVCLCRHKRSLVRVCRAKNDRLCIIYTCDNYVIQIKMKNKGGLFIECDTRYFWNFKRACRRYVCIWKLKHKHKLNNIQHAYSHIIIIIIVDGLWERTGSGRRSVSRLCLACAILRVILNVRVCVIQSYAFLYAFSCYLPHSLLPDAVLLKYNVTCLLWWCRSNEGMGAGLGALFMHNSQGVIAHWWRTHQLLTFNTSSSVQPWRIFT